MKKLILTVIFAISSLITFAQDNTYQLSSHILDISQGKPASGVTIRLEKYNEQTKKWAYVDEKVTDKNGRISDFLDSKRSNPGIYKLTYFTSDYFKKNHTESFYPFIEVVFQIKDNSHYHVPITLSAFGYSTYRGN
ncbi:hydroxyisourate hydrolase [Pontibacter sp. BT310]|uniref:5-hydroxyisourate hydrolase n=1 Tax=Pontibacter populi TaxID=890055 RepID=A0ABS6XEG0_9BACT|nr:MULTISPECIES: hydroxyisourate hydrolase [Pontibacter]MBJ6119418.1 hydroxyisourate hydrolase [Pontibacter sp. BT310]MBR0571846.1 hydroxyisourate hydrolase [Microvirga sp. STS03]MBW3366272.1 hydroxyisourate hydrolase [Pontibacter populi]